VATKISKYQKQVHNAVGHQQMENKLGPSLILEIDYPIRPMQSGFENNKLQDIAYIKQLPSTIQQANNAVTVKCST